MGDLTTEMLGIGETPARLIFEARQEMVVCGSEEAAQMFELLGAEASRTVRSGRKLNGGGLILVAEGTAGSLHRGWKAAQTIVEWASGVATATAAIVSGAAGIPVACTRKNVPGTKAMAAKAVRAGGGIMHRLGLSESVLLFPEHRLFLHESPDRVIALLRQQQPEKKVIVEVGSIDEALIWARAGADVLQLEKFSPEQVETCRITLNRWPGMQSPLLAAAGGIHAGNANAYAAAGADLLVTSAPYMAPPKDVRVTFSKIA